jgi:thiamine pyridinylase
MNMFLPADTWVAMGWRKQSQRLAWFILVVTCFTAGCSWITPPIQDPPPAEVPARATLRVALFPYIPDSGGDQYVSLVRHLKTEFEKKYPTIELVLRPLNQADDFYDLEVLRAWLTAPGQQGYDVVEADTVLLGDLVTAGLISPWRQPTGDRDWHPVAARSVRINEAVYGIPHLLCGHFLITRNRAAAAARNVDELAAALGPVPQGSARLVGNLLGSWNMPSLFLDAWVDGRPGSSAAYALHTPIDADALAAFKRFSSLCRHQGGNPCLDGTYDEEKHPARAAEKFAQGEAEALLGYSERLFFIASKAADLSSLLVTPAQMGRGNRPLLFTDAFVLRRQAPAAVEVAARLFAAFMNSQTVQETLLMSADVSPTAIPRYLLPATMSAFEAPRIKQDRLYQDFKKAISVADPFPNTGFLNTRKALRDALKTSLEQP